MWQAIWDSYKEYIIIGGALYMFWDLNSRPMTEQEIRNSRRIQTTNKLISYAGLAALIWFVWWVWTGKCLFACSYLGMV